MLIFPPNHHFSLQVMEGSVMNKLYHVANEKDSSQRPLVVRINGSIAEQYDLDRTQEVDIMRRLLGKNLVPDLIASFQNGIIYEYIPGDKMTKSEFTDVKYLR